MNARVNNFSIEENSNSNNSESDSDTDVTPEYYQPISAVDSDHDQSNSDEEPYSSVEVENGISTLHLNGGVEQKSSDDEEEEEQEEENEERVGEEASILRAFREDETRRNAPLTPENATRVMEAMRGISFSGSVPDWAGRVPEDQWIHQLRSLRQQQLSPN